ncbi:MAG: hypothetical protein SH820_05505 [Xanthomonadales bacterium]|nr:hypothetical protein [Xanthomonadales bacterium]
MQDFSSYPLLVAIETDATRYHGVSPSRPRLLAKTDADQLLAHVSADLATLFPGSDRCSLVGPGALFDQTQLLRPAYPIFKCLESSLQQSGKGYGSRLLSIGARENVMPRVELQPEADIPLGILQVLPLVLRGPAADVAELGQEMERCFLERGQLSPQSAQWLEAAFGIRINHARFMTLTDLRAMFNLQLEHFGFLPLWQLIDAALEQSTGELEVQSDTGPLFRWRNGAVHIEYQTFDYWAQQGPGKTTDPSRGKLAGGYADWTRQLRQYLATLRAHAVEVVFHQSDQPELTMPGQYFVEQSSYSPQDSDASVTEHSFAELGTVCISHAHAGKLEHYYPLAPQGINEIHTAIRKNGLAEGTVAFPGSILYDERSRGLMAESVRGQIWH